MKKIIVAMFLLAMSLGAQSAQAIAIPRITCHVNILHACAEATFLGTRCPRTWVVGRC